MKIIYYCRVARASLGYFNEDARKIQLEYRCGQNFDILTYII